MFKPKKIKLDSGVRWEVDCYIDGRGSKRMRRRFLKKIDAEVFIKNLLAKNSEERAELFGEDKSQELTLESEVNYWLQVRGRELSSSHLKRVRGIYEKLLPDHGSLPILKIDLLFLSGLRAELLSKGFSNATVNRWTNTITTVVNFSFKAGRIKANKVSGFGLLNEFREEMSHWEKHEISEFLSFADNKYQKEKRWVFVVYLLALNTGLRAGEIWGLKVKDVNFERKIINVERQLLLVNRKISPTKGRNIRKVPCNGVLERELKRLIALRETPESFLFENSVGNAINHDNFRYRFFVPDLKKSKVRAIRFHDLRHTALSQMVEAGINLKVVQSIAGHADIKTTMKYVHLLGDSISNVAESISLSSDDYG